MMRAPLVFYDQTPIGRILSRFSSDQDATDNKIPEMVSDGMYCLFEVTNMLSQPFKIILEQLFARCKIVHQANPNNEVVFVAYFYKLCCVHKKSWRNRIGHAWGVKAFWFPKGIPGICFGVFPPGAILTDQKLTKKVFSWKSFKSFFKLKSLLKALLENLTKDNKKFTLNQKVRKASENHVSRSQKVKCLTLGILQTQKKWRSPFLLIQPLGLINFPLVSWVNKNKNNLTRTILNLSRNTSR